MLTFPASRMGLFCHCLRDYLPLPMPIMEELRLHPAYPEIRRISNVREFQMLHGAHRGSANHAIHSLTRPVRLSIAQQLPEGIGRRRRRRPLLLSSSSGDTSLPFVWHMHALTADFSELYTYPDTLLFVLMQASLCRDIRIMLTFCCPRASTTSDRPSVCQQQIHPCANM